MPDFDIRCLILVAAFVLDAVAGDPERIWGRIPHPVVLIGRLIAFLEERLNRKAFRPLVRRLNGAASAFLVPALAAAIGWALSHLGAIIETLLVAILLAQRSLYDHVAAVADALAQDGLAGGRAAVARIVGRDPAALDEPGVARAAIESLAENFSDGVAAPAFWYLVGGLPGLCAYKAINTADSMVGHRTPRRRDYGWAAARLDDLANLLPARVSGLLIALASWVSGGDSRAALRALRYDAPRHTSPNAGWPEAAMAGALGLALAGPRVYSKTSLTAAFMNERGRIAATADDIRAALQLYITTCILQAALVSAVAAAAY